MHDRRLPDTQHYSDNEVFPDYPDGIAVLFFAQTQWVVDNRSARNIQFVCHLGDMVDNGTITFSTYSPALDRERTIIDDFMDTLGIITAYKDALAEAIGLTEFQKAVILSQMRADLPGYSKAPELEAYLQQPEVQTHLKANGMDYAWDGLWKQAFADGQRDPSVTMAVDFDAYLRADR